MRFGHLKVGLEAILAAAEVVVRVTRSDHELTSGRDEQRGVVGVKAPVLALPERPREPSGGRLWETEWKDRSFLWQTGNLR